MSSVVMVLFLGLDSNLFPVNHSPVVTLLINPPGNYSSPFLSATINPSTDAPTGKGKINLMRPCNKNKQCTVQHFI